MIPGNHYAARKPQYDSRYFIYVSSPRIGPNGEKTPGSILIEETGEFKPRTALASYLLKFRPDKDTPVILTNDAAGVVKELDDVFQDHPKWTWRATPLRRTKRSAAKSPQSKPAVSIRLNPLYCGFKRVNGKQQNRFFHFIDVVQLTGRTSQHFYEGDEIRTLVRFGEAYRSMCRENGMKMTGQRGKFGGAMLRDPRFIGVSQRRIPEVVNEAVRPHLPGNHYELRAETEQTINNALYLDISNAHHNAARVTHFPDPAGLRIRGKRLADWPDLSPNTEPWADSNTRKFERLLRTHGLVALQAIFRGAPKGAILHPAARSATVNRPNLVFAFTNEIELLKQSGFEFLGAYGGITAGRTDKSLNRYAEHAIENLARVQKGDREWMKSLYLSTYGMLGKRGSTYQSVSNLRGQPFNWPTPEGWLEGKMMETTRAYSPSTTNVLALGMIQAETRRNVIELARHLETYPHVTVIALYADSLIVTVRTESTPTIRTQTHSRKTQNGSGGTIPILPPEWRIKTELTDLRFFNPVSFVSRQEERLPGIGRESTLRESRRRAIRARARQHNLPPQQWLEELAADANRKRVRV